MPHAENAPPLGIYVYGEQRKGGLGSKIGSIVSSNYREYTSKHSSTAHNAFFSIFNAAYHDISFPKLKNIGKDLHCNTFWA